MRAYLLLIVTFALLSKGFAIKEDKKQGFLAPEKKKLFRLPLTVEINQVLNVF